MVRFNGKLFRVYMLDTRDGALDRLAASLSTLPRYLYFPDGIPTLEQLRSSNLDLQVEDSLRMIIETESAAQLVEYFSTRMAQQDLSWIADVLTPYIVLNKTLRSYPEEVADLMIMQSWDDMIHSGYLTEREKTLFNPVKVWQSRKITAETINKERSALKTNAEKHTVLLKQFDSLKEGAQTTDFFAEEVRLDFRLDIPNPSVLSIFNRVVLNKNAPFATSRDFYKILKDTVPSAEWANIPSPQDGIYLKILQSERPKIKYSDALIDFSSDEIRVYADIALAKGAVTREEAMQEIVSVFPDLDSSSVGVPRESAVKGMFYFPNRTLNNDVFADLAMNNPLFSYVIVINERDKASKDKNDIQIRFIHPLTGTLNVYLTEYKQTDKTPKALRPILGSSYVRATISEAPSTEAANLFRNVLAKLMHFYDEEYENIIATYRKYLGSKFSVKTRPKQVEKSDDDNNPLRRDHPKVFRPFYSRWCREERMPSVVGREDADGARAEGMQVMEFPKQGTPGYDTLNIVCNASERYKYPGLIENRTDNSSELPFLPCCYVKSQVGRGAYKSYYEGGSPAEDVGQEEPKRRGGDDNIFQDGKIVPVDKTGYLPPNVREFFWTVDVDDRFEYLRTGTHRTKSSFLDCVLQALDIDDISDIEDQDEREERLAEVRRELARPEIAALCKQQMYDSSVGQIMQQIADPDVYFDPKLFLALVQEVYDCNVFIFSKRVAGGTMELPRHTKGLFYSERPAPTIIVLEHSGSESDQAKYPQCELIVRWNKEDDTDVTDTYDYNKTPVPQLRETFSKLQESYALDKPIPITKFLRTPLPFLIEGQAFDSYGKCRLISIVYEGVKASIATSPMAPFLAPPIEWEDAPRIDSKTGLKLVASMSMVLTGQLVDDDGVVRAFVGTVGNVDVSILLEDSEEVPGLPTYEEGMGINDPSKSVMASFRSNRRIAFFIRQYAIWLYSLYLGGDVPTDANLASFAESRIRIDPNFSISSSYASRELSMDSPLLTDGDIVVRSLDEAKRLVYTLRVACARDPSFVQTFREREVVDDFYETAADFTAHPNQVTVSGYETLRKWIEDSVSKNTMHSSIVLRIRLVTEDGVENIIALESDAQIAESRDVVAAGEQYRALEKVQGLITKAREELASAKGMTVRFQLQEKIEQLEERLGAFGARVELVESAPYFFMNELVEPNTVFLAQNTDTVEKAVAIAETWYSRGYNPGSNPEPSESTAGFTFFSYVNANKITRYIYTGTGLPRYPIKMLGYQVGGMKRLTVLLDL